MSTSNHARPIAGPIEVDQLATQIPVAHVLGQNGSASLDATGASRQQERADQVVSMARRHAEEIRTAAEREAERILADAERQASSIYAERLDAYSRELDGMTALRREISSCLETAVAALQNARELSAAQAESVSAPASDSSTPAAAFASPATEAASSDRHRTLYLIALGIWGALMSLIVLILLLPPSDDKPERTAAPYVLEQKPPVEDRGSSVVPASARSAAEASGLTVTFIASRECWLSIIIDDGRPSERLLKPSETYTVQARDAVTVKAGNASALSLRINGEPAAPLGIEGQVVTRRITRENFRTFLLSSAVQNPVLVAQVP